MDSNLNLDEQAEGDGHDLFTAFFAPLQQALVASRTAIDSEIDYLDSEGGLALQWATSISRQ